MRLLLDECMPKTLVEALRSRGHDVRFIREEAQGIADAAVLAQATNDGRLLVTEDRDFGLLTFRNRQPAVGVIIVAVSAFTWPAAKLAQHVCDVLEELGQSCIGSLTTIEPGRFRQRTFDPQG